jgi:hypothetical protein
VPLALPGLAPIQITPEPGAVLGSFVPPSADKGGRAVAKTDHQRHMGSATEHRKRDFEPKWRSRGRTPEPPPDPTRDENHQGIISLLV